MTANSLDHAFVSQEGDTSNRRFFKKAKSLPRPTNIQSPHPPPRYPRSMAQAEDPFADPDLLLKKQRPTTSQPLNPQALKHQARRMRSGPILPPTPPAHSRTSSGSQSLQPSSPKAPSTPSHSAEKVTLPAERPTTPRNQHSPPTPDVTPPQPSHRPQALRPAVGDRSVSKATTNSQADSFITAMEEPWQLEDDSVRSTTRPGLLSTRSSQRTVRQARQTSRGTSPIGLGLGIEADNAGDEQTPTKDGGSGSFDGGWSSPDAARTLRYDSSERKQALRQGSKPPSSHATSRRSKQGRVPEDKFVTPTNATQALRSASLRDGVTNRPRSSVDVDSDAIRQKPDFVSDISHSQDRRRHSAMSSKSNVSTVVEAFLVDSSPTQPRRQTLRHVRKRGALRDSVSDISGTSELGFDPRASPDSPSQRPSVAAARSIGSRSISGTTSNSISSGKARREVLKNGGIPVVVVPGRLSSMKSSRTPSLRSTSSHRTKRSQSQGSVPQTRRSWSTERTPVFDRPIRRGRAASESDGSVRTMDFAPEIPARSSSLSAPTSRNNSRAGSMTAESLRSRNGLIDHDAEPPRVQKPGSQHGDASVESSPEAIVNPRSPHTETDHPGDRFWGRRLSTQNTPFSVGSLETDWTAPEIAEALAVSLYPHQNSSVRMVNHFGKDYEDGLDEDDYVQPDTPTRAPQPRPVLNDEVPGQDEVPDSPPQQHQQQQQQPTFALNDKKEVPATPPQPIFALNDIDSPLRNPRVPPVPPAINFIPATPSGSTPHTERQRMMGNYFEGIDEEKPPRSMSLVRRALTAKRRHSVSYPPRAGRTGFLRRTLSLSRHGRRNSATADGERIPDEDAPADETKLHPLWRPAFADDYEDDWDMHDEYDPYPYRYPLVDNRPHRPSRKLSTRMKRTFAIFPIEDDDDRFPPEPLSTERRTISRSPSGALRVIRRRRSLESLRDSRPFTAPHGESELKFGWPRRDHARERGGPMQPRRRFSMSNTFGELHDLPRRFSEMRREKRTQELRQKISRPQEVRDGVGDVIRRRYNRDSRA